MATQTPCPDPAPPLVLLAEDDGDMRELVAGMLRRDGYVVLEARDGPSLLRLIQVTGGEGRLDVAPELIISDIRMPGMTGMEVLTWVRSADWLTPVILLTGFGDRATHMAAARLGAAAVFDKPFELAALRQRVTDILPMAGRG